MALSDVGVIFVSKGFADFMKNMSKASQAITSFSSITQNRLKALQSYNDAMVKTAKYARDIAVSNDRLIVSQQKTAQANLRLKTTQAQVAISANQAKTAQANFSKSFNDAAIAANKAAVALRRLDVIDKLNDAMIAGAISSEDYATGLDAINYSASRMSSSLNKSANALSIIQDIGGALGGSISSLGGMGSTIGGIIGSIFPVIGTTIGAIGGYILGAIAGLGVGIVKSIFSIATNIGKTIINVGKKIFNSVVSVFKGIISGVKNFLGEIFNLLTGGIFKSGWNNLGNTIVSSMFKFEILKQVIRKVVTEIRSLADAAAQGAIDFQKLDARLRFLIRMQIKATDTTMSLAKATELAGEQARQLEFWIARTALQSPVSVDEVAETVSLSIAMGWAVDAAKELTSAIIDYTSATGLGKDIAERIIYNFAQMKQQGKVTGTELRDLGRGAFMPINTILEIMYEDLKKVNDEMGATTMSFADFREEAAAGKIDVEGFFKAFEEFVSLNMAGAAYEMNYTFAAVADNMRDLFKIFLGWNVLGPLIQSVTKPFQDFIEMLSTNEALLAANRIGKALAFAIEYVKKGIGELFRVFGLFFKRIGFVAPSIENVVKTIVKLGRAFYYVANIVATFIKNALNPFATAIHKKFGEPLDNMRKNFFEWGANLVVSFAKGMVEAAAKTLTSVMNFIANILTGWLRPGSPPRILPDIDQWGMDTINEWLHGFEKGDFSILENVQGAISDALGALVNFGLITEQESNQEYLHLITELMRAMDEWNTTGTISAGIFEELASIGGVYGAEIAELLRLEIAYAEQLKQKEAYELAVAEATNAVEQAQKEYNDAVKATQISTQKTNRLIREYNNMLRKGADKQQLKNKLKMVNASYQEMLANQKAEEQKKSQVEIAQEQLELAEDALKAFEDALIPLQDQLELQRDLIRQLTELAKAQKDNEDAAEGTGDALEDIIDALDDISDGFEWEDPWEDSDLEGWIASANEEFDNWVKNVLPGLWGDAWNVNFVDPNSPFQKALGKIWEKLPDAFDKVTGLLKSAWDDFADHMKLPSWEKITEAWNQLPNGMTQEQWDLLPPSVRNAMAPTLLDRFRNVLQAFSDAIPDDATIGDILAGIGSYLLEKLGLLLQGFADDPNTMQGITNAINSVVGWMEKVFMGDESSGEKPPVTVLADALTQLLIQAAGKLTTAIAPGSPIYNTFVSVGSAMGAGIIEGIKSQFRIDPNSPVGKILDFLGLLQEAAEIPIAGGGLPSEGPNIRAGKDEIDTYNQYGVDLVDGLISGMEDAMEDKDWEDIYKPITDGFVARFDNESPSRLYNKYGVDIINGLSDGIDDQIKATNWNNIWKVIIDKFMKLFGISSPTSISTVFKVFGGGIVKGLSSGITSQISSTNWNNIWKVIINRFTQLFGIPSTGSSSTVFKSFGISIVKGLSDGIRSQISSTEWSNVWQVIINKFMQLFGISAPGNNSTVFKALGADVVNGFKQGFVDTVNTIIGGPIPSAINSIINKVKTIFGFYDEYPEFWEIGRDILQDFIGGLDFMKQRVWNKAEDVFGPVIDLIEEIFDRGSPSAVLFDIAVDVANGFINGLESMRDMVDAKILELLGSAPDTIKTELEVSSPSGVYEEIGKKEIRNIISGIELAKQSAINSMWMSGDAESRMRERSIMEISKRIMSKEFGVSNVYGGNTVYFGDVHINNDMDWAVFKAQVHRAIIEG